ncbi:MAG TPA: hypothetical protein VGQ83_33000 [Polyangia bacterium]
MGRVVRIIAVGQAGLLLLLVAACGSLPRRFPLAAPLWQDPDHNDVPRRPAPTVANLLAFQLDWFALYPLSQATAVRPSGEAVNVNALDEVPDSSWFQNRIGRRGMTPDEVAQGPCEAPPPDPRRGPWVVTRGKDEGATSGLFITAPEGRYLLKFDSRAQAPRATAADAIAARLLHAAGYFVPCEQIVYLSPADLRIGPGATVKDQYGHKRPLTPRDVERALLEAWRLPDGRLRASASRILAGEVLGPWRYLGRRTDDPNDVIPHEDRREVRGLRLFAAWLNHWDSQDANTVDVWVTAQGRRFVRHYLLDFNECFGGMWVGGVLVRRLGHAHWIDLAKITGDFLSLGTLPRPWYRARPNAFSGTFGFYEAQGFVPSEWRASHRVPAFERMTTRDALWMVRIIGSFSPAHLRAAVAAGQLPSPLDADYLVETLQARQRAILREYLRANAPLVHFRVTRASDGREQLCFADLAVRQRLVPPREVRYELRAYGGDRLDELLGWRQLGPGPGDAADAASCVSLPIGLRRAAELAPRGAADDHRRRYEVIAIDVYQRPGETATSTLRLHLYDLGPERGYRLVGIERRPEAIPSGHCVNRRSWRCPPP